MTTGLDQTTQQLLTESLRELFGGDPDAPTITAALEELGWEEVFDTDRRAATTVLFTEQGRCLARSRALDDIVLDQLSDSLPASTGRRAVLYPHPAIRNGGILLGPLDGVDDVVAPSWSAEPAIRIVPADALGSHLEPANGFDRSSGWLLVRDLDVDSTASLGVGRAGADALAAAHRAIATELVAICAKALELAAAHTASRIQFGRPLATFQGVRHRLAEAHVEIESARTALNLAWDVIDDPDHAAVASRIAKLRVGRAQALVFRHALQVFGAVGLTMESDLHRYATRAATLDDLLGGHDQLAEQLGSALVDEMAAQRMVQI